MPRLLILWLAASLWLLSAPALADAPVYSLEKDKSFVKFFAIENGASIEGRFKDFSADIHFNPDDLEHSTITAEVKTGSFDVANDDVAKNLRLPEWLSVDAFPTAVFKSDKITMMPKSKNYYATGTLTLRGKSMPVMLNFQMDRMNDSGAIATGFITLFRNQFGVGQGEWAKDDAVKDEVRVELRIVADKK